MNLSELKNNTTLSIAERQYFFSNYILGHFRPKTWLDQFEGVFRSRKIEESKIPELKTVKEIWYKDQSIEESLKQTKGRCHNFGQNFFYSSNDVETTIKELRPENGQFILIGEFKLKQFSKTPECQFAGIETLRRHKMWSTLLGNYEYAKTSDKKIEEFIAECFRKEELNDEYHNTIAITNILLNNESTDCLVYPSVASNLSSLNYGFKPEYVDEYFNCTNIWIYQYRIIQNTIELIPVKYAVINPNFMIQKESKIEWKDSTVYNHEILKYCL